MDGMGNIFPLHGGEFNGFNGDESLGIRIRKKMTNYKQTVQNYNPWKSLATIFYRLVSEPPLFL